MPVTETIELIGRLRAETTVSLAGVIVNRVLPELFGTREGQAFEAICGGADERSSWPRRSGAGPSPLLDAARLTVKMRRSRAAHLERLRESVSAGTPARPPSPCCTCPTSSALLRLRSTRQIAAALAAELES